MIYRVGGWRPVVLGLGLGLFVSRSLAEFAGFPGPWPQPLLLLPVLAGLGISLAALATRRKFDLGPLTVLWIYVIFPSIEPRLAAGAAFVGLIAVLHRALRGRLPSREWTDLLLFTLALLLYLHTLAPTVLPADSGEFQLVSAVLGIAHPPGYPLYTLLGKLFTLVPFAEIATRLNLLSAVAAALTLVLVSRTVRRASGSCIGGWAAAVALGASTTFWAQATTANIRMLTAFFAALMLWLAVTYASKGRPRDLVFLAAAAGLGIGHHGSLLWMMPPVLAFLWWSRPNLFTQVRSWRRPAIALALSFLPLLYVPLRAATGAPFGAEGIRDLPSALDHLLARGFQGDILYFATPETLPQRMAILANALEIQFGGPLLLLVLVSVLLLLWRDRPLALLLGGSFALVAFVGITYRAPQSVEYMLPAYLSVAIAFGYLVGSAARLPGRTLPALAAATLLLPAGISLADRFPSYQTLARDRSARDYAEAVFDAAPRGATVLANWHWATPLWYLQQVEGERLDLEIVYVFPEGAIPISDSWVRRIGDSLDDGPVLVTRFFESYRHLPYRFLPLAEAWLVDDGRRFEPPRDYDPVDATFGDRIRFLGFRVGLDGLSPGSSLSLDFAWQVLEVLEDDHAIFVHLVDPTGHILGQMDRTYPAGQLEPQEVVTERFEFPILPTAYPGSYRLIAGAYLPLPEGGWKRLTTADGHETALLSRVSLNRRTDRPLSLHPVHQPFQGGLTLIGTDYDSTFGGERRIYLHWHLTRTVPGPYRVELVDSDSVLAEESLIVSGSTAAGYQTIAFDVPQVPGPLTLRVRTASEEILDRLGPWGAPLPWPAALRPPMEGDRYVVLGGEMILARVEAGGTARPGGAIPVDLLFVAQKPLTRDYAVSIRLTGLSGRLISAHDSTAALGAIPTLKWIRGTRVRDPHYLSVPEIAEPGSAMLNLVVYDAFTLIPLAILDERISQLGPATPLGSIEIAS